jgi:hypothetical protein
MKAAYDRAMAEIAPLLPGESWKGLDDWNKSLS